MKVVLVSVGKPRGPLLEPIAEYEQRAARYFSFEPRVVREEPARANMRVEQVRQQEGKRLLARVPPGAELVALHRGGTAWSSERLARYLTELTASGRTGCAFAIGGAFGLSQELLEAADHRLSLSALTLPHELARLVLAEQIYRAGTIIRGEPYHKTR